ncbi:MAG: B12-binding domain-containing radical SAM protein, partial [Candidatus Omnitrophica bacterium]|nr:B12-binding domain-containing radical SAM protein [Candidatus Omnitrophota bacterium]
MKIVIAYPPITTDKGCPLLGQNRQFQYFKDPTYIYPVVPAQAATLLKKNGFEVVWLDAIAENISYERFIEIIKNEKPDLIAMETKTPVIKEHWRIINDLKSTLRTTNQELRTVLFGDHVTALPEESFQNSKVDYVLTGGDYDFLLLNLCNFIKYGDSPQKAGTVSILEPGIYYRENEIIKNTGKFQLNHNLDALPFIDRDLTKWRLYAYANGNYKRTPGTYIMSARDCWWGKCTFCSWPTLYPKFRNRPVKNVLDEIGELITQYNVREIMDDAGTFPVGAWLSEFCKGMIERGYNKKIYFDCNMRFGAVTYSDLKLMKQANFRLLLFGLESANQNTLDRLKKNLKVEDIIQGCRLARKAGLYPHITIMFGYPWETYEEALKTLNLGRWLLKKGFAYTMQATMVIPYPGSPLFEECKQNNWLKTLDWDDYDMKQPVMRAQFPDPEITKLVQGMYKISFQPEFMLRKLFSLRDFDDFKYYLRAGGKVFGHIFDFRK